MYVCMYVCECCAFVYQSSNVNLCECDVCECDVYVGLVLWCVVCGVWRVVCGVWCVVFGRGGIDVLCCAVTLGNGDERRRRIASFERSRPRDGFHRHASSNERRNAQTASLAVGS